MQARTKQSYHPFVLVAFYLDILPENLLDWIPRSTKNDWQHKKLTELFGYDWYLQNRHLFNTLQQVAVNKNLLLVNKVLLKVIAVKVYQKL